MVKTLNTKNKKEDMSKSKKKYIVQNIDGGTIASNYVNRSSFVKVGSRKKRSEST